MDFKRSLIASKDEGHRIAFGDNERKYQLWERPGKGPGAHDFRLKLGSRTLADFSTKEAPDATMQDVYINAVKKAGDLMREEVERINDKYEYGEVRQVDLDNRADYQDAVFSCVIVENAFKRDKANGLSSMEEDWAKEFSNAVDEMSGKDPAPPEQ